MTVEFDSVQRPAAMFAEALLGRPVRIEMADAQPPSGRRPLATAAGDLVVVLPAEVAAFGEPELDRRLFRHAVLHQAGYELFGTRSFDVDAFLDDHPERPSLDRVFTAIEECRVDAAVRHRFPGAVDDVRRAASLVPRLPRRLASTLDTIERRDDLHRWTVDDVARLALALTEPETPLPALLDPSEIDLPSDPDQRAAAVRSGGGEEGEGKLDALLLDVLGFAADVEEVPEGAEADGPVGDGDLPEESPGRAPSGGKQELAGTRARTAAAKAGAGSGDRSFLYDEWDVNARRYLQAWCRVHERPLQGGDPGFIGDVRRRHAALARQVRRQFSMIAAESWHRLHRERDGGELDLDEVVASMVDRRAGIVDDEHLHIRQVRAAREVAAAFLLDMSASTSAAVIDPDAPPPPPRPEPSPDEILYPAMSWDDDPPVKLSDRTVLDLAKESLAVMCDALHVLGDEHAIYGFSGSGRDGVDFYVAKELREAPSTRTWSRLAAMKPRQYTRMGPAIRHATTKLRGHGARTRFLVVVSDGYPQDRDYGPDRADRSYGIADTAKAIEEAERVGVLTFCITVDPAGHDYLREMCAEERYLVIDDVNALPGELTKMYRSLVLAHR